MDKHYEPLLTSEPKGKIETYNCYASVTGKRRSYRMYKIDGVAYIGIERYCRAFGLNESEVKAKNMNYVDNFHSVGLQDVVMMEVWYWNMDKLVKRLKEQGYKNVHFSNEFNKRGVCTDSWQEQKRKVRAEADEC